MNRHLMSGDVSALKLPSIPLESTYHLFKHLRSRYCPMSSFGPPHSCLRVAVTSHNGTQYGIMDGVECEVEHPPVNSLHVNRRPERSQWCMMRMDGIQHENGMSIVLDQRFSRLASLSVL